MTVMDCIKDGGHRFIETESVEKFENVMRLACSRCRLTAYRNAFGDVGLRHPAERIALSRPPLYLVA